MFLGWIYPYSWFRWIMVPSFILSLCWVFYRIEPPSISKCHASQQTYKTMNHPSWSLAAQWNQKPQLWSPWSGHILSNRQPPPHCQELSCFETKTEVFQQQKRTNRYKTFLFAFTPVTNFKNAMCFIQLQYWLLHICWLRFIMLLPDHHYQVRLISTGGDTNPIVFEYRLPFL